MMEPSGSSGGDARQDAAPHTTLPRSWIRRYLFTTDHRTIGVQYLLLALVAVLIGSSLSLLMRIHLAWPALPLRFPIRSG